MARPSSYPLELRQRAIRTVAESKSDHGSELEAIQAVATKLGIGSTETLRKWIRRARSMPGERPGVTTEESENTEALKKENAELRRANEILKSAAAFFGRSSTAHTGSHRLHQAAQGPVRVEPIYTVLSEHGCPIAPSTYYDHLSRRPNRRAPRDAELKRLIDSECEGSKFVRLLGRAQDVAATARPGP